MKHKASIKSNELIDIFQARLGWNKARVESNLRRIQRFFAEFIVDTNLIAKLIFSLLPEKPPYRICLDRTNWKYGVTNINILMVSIAYQGLAIPILWTMLPKRGNIILPKIQTTS